METVVFERPMDSRLEHVDFSLLFNTLSQRKSDPSFLISSDGEEGDTVCPVTEPALRVCPRPVGPALPV